MKKREEAMKELEVKQNERTKQLMEERIKKTKEKIVITMFEGRYKNKLIILSMFFIK